MTGGRAGRGILVYGMYDLSGLDKAPKVRITLMSEALQRQIRTERIVGGRGARTVRALRWLASGGHRRVDAVYVEPTTSALLPNDLAFLAMVRLLGLPVGIYFRDAYQLFRHIHPKVRRRQVIVDQIWRLTLPLMARLATVRYVQSEGMGRALHLREPVMLPPGTDPAAPDLGAGSEPLVAYVGNTGWADGFDLLVEAMAIVRRHVPDARLLVVSRPSEGSEREALPDYVEIRQAGRDELPELLRDARVCVIPRRKTAYADIVLPVKLFDYLSLGKPILAANAEAEDAFLATTGAGIVTPDTAQGLAAGLTELLSDLPRAQALAAAARAYACSDGATWDARARTVLRTLGVRAAE